MIAFGIDTMSDRISMRSFDGVPVEESRLRSLREVIEECVPGPFGGRARFALVTPVEEGQGSSAGGGLARSGKIGTYGLISKVPAFVVGAIAKGPGALEDFGYSMEGLVLKITELGLGSCWIGGLFDRGAAGAALELKGEELLPAVIAFGAPAEKRSVADSLTWRLARASTRKPAEDLFFDEELGQPLALEKSPWREVLESVRVAPSASNKQPWRILRRGSEDRPIFDFLLREDRLYNAMLGPVHLQNIDMGIAMRHFESGARSLGLPGSWTIGEKPPRAYPPPLSYSISWET